MTEGIKVGSGIEQELSATVVTGKKDHMHGNRFICNRPFGAG